MYRNTDIRFKLLGLIMLDIDFEDALVEKCGGKFALTSLLQKRMVELNRGAPPLVVLESDQPDRDLRRLACTEILEGKIKLGPREEIEYVKQEEKPIPEPEAPVEEKKGESQEIYGSDIKRIKEQRIKELAQLLNPKK